MKPTLVRTLSTLLLIVLTFQSRAEVLFDSEDIKDRLEKMECIVKPRYTTAVESYIKGYFAKDAFKAKIVLSRTLTYFPLFEKYLAEHDMPDDLKYLAVVESALSPRAVSRVGATGLWQFMKETGTSYGLKINSRVDERSCPHSSTEAAMEYLARAYKRFGSWELALASYNCGAGNINRAIRRSGTKDYWSLSKYLPRETRNFVPAFLGAAYVLKYYHLHSIDPEYPDLDLQLVEPVQVYNEMPLETVAAITGIPRDVIEYLNPVFKKGYIPAHPDGHHVMLPKRVSQALIDYIQLLRPDNGSASELPELPELVDTSQYEPNDYYYRTYYTIAKGDRLRKLGNIFNCSGLHLKAWNNLKSDEVNQGEELLVWFPEELRRYQPFNEKIKALPLERKKAPKAVENRPPSPKIKPIDPIKLTPIPVNEKKELPFTAMTPAEVNQRLSVGEAKPDDPKKTTTIQKIKRWVHRKSPFKKKK